MMNRIQHPTKSAKPAPPSPTFRIESGLFVSSSAHDASRVLFGPKHYEPNYAYPLLVWLHGPGCDERQLVRIMPVISLRNYVAVAPRGFLHSGESSNRAGYLWPETDECIEEAAWRISEAVEAAGRKFHLARNRVFLGGFDAGGTMALRVAMSDPGRFAAALSIGGRFPRGRTPFHCLTEARRLPVFLAVGRDSPEYSPDTACDDLRLLHAAGMSIILRQYPCGQELTEQMLRDVDRWIIEQITLAADA